MYSVLPSGFRYSWGRYALPLGLLCLALSFGCDLGTAPSIYDPNRSSLPDPVIESVMPEGSALAGVDEVTITGSNFSEVKENNLVYFGTARGVVTQASATQLRMIAPNDPQPELNLRLVIVGAENFSNSVAYGLDPPFIQFGDVKKSEDVYGITTDQDGNVYASLAAFDLPTGITRMTPEGERSEFISSTFLWADMAFGPDNHLYAVRSVRALFRYEEGGTRFAVFAVIPNTTTRLATLAIDANGRIWTAGNNADIYRVDTDKTVTAYPFEADVRDLTVFGSFLYVTGVKGGVSKVWRFMINASGNLGSPEDFFDVTAFHGSEAYALAFATNGHLYVGTDAMDPVIVVDPNGAGEVLYPGVLRQPSRRFAWGPRGHLYASTNSTDSSPAGMIRITTRRDGFRKFGF